MVPNRGPGVGARSYGPGAIRHGATAGRIWIIDDHPLVASTLADSLRCAGHDAHVGPLRPAPDLLAIFGPAGAGLVLLDLELGCDRAGHRIDGGALVGPLRASGWRVLALTDNTTPERIGAALAAGAAGALPKTASLDALLAALQNTLAGRPVHPPTQHRDLIERHHRHQRDDHDLRKALAALTVREHAVLELLAAGHRAQTIAALSVVSLATVRKQIRAVLTKLGVHSQLEAVAIYTRQRHLDP